MPWPTRRRGHGSRFSAKWRPSPPLRWPEGKERYLARWPQAANYFALGDFALWRFEIEEARLIAGFGEIRWLKM